MPAPAGGGAVGMPTAGNAPDTVSQTPAADQNAEGIAALEAKIADLKAKIKAIKDKITALANVAMHSGNAPGLGTQLPGLQQQLALLKQQLTSAEAKLAALRTKPIQAVQPTPPTPIEQVVGDPGAASQAQTDDRIVQNEVISLAEALSRGGGSSTAMRATQATALRSAAGAQSLAASRPGGANPAALRAALQQGSAAQGSVAGQAELASTQTSMGAFDQLGGAISGQAALDMKVYAQNIEAEMGLADSAQRDRAIAESARQADMSFVEMSRQYWEAAARKDKSAMNGIISAGLIGLGTVVGAVVGTGPAGAAVGAAVGGAAASAVTGGNN